MRKAILFRSSYDLFASSYFDVPQVGINEMADLTDDEFAREYLNPTIHNEYVKSESFLAAEEAKEALTQKKQGSRAEVLADVTEDWSMILSCLAKSNLLHRSTNMGVAGIFDGTRTQDNSWTRWIGMQRVPLLQ